MAMLPFLKNRMMASVIVVKDKDDKEMSAKADEGLKQACSSMLKAISGGDADKLAEAFKAAFDICESQPHEEYEEEEDEE